MAGVGAAIDGIFYDLDGDSAKVSGYFGEYSGNVVIPSEVTYNATTYKVTSIGSYAFKGCSGLTSVTIPGSVTSIGELAFRYCSGLTSITIPESVTSIGNGAFMGCSGLTSITIPESVTSIGEFAFRDCASLVSIEVAAGNRFYSSFDGMLYDKSVSKLILCLIAKTTVSIPNSVTSIGNNAFYGCSGLTSVTIPGSVTSIGEYAFCYCSSLTSVTIPEGVTSIGKSAFRGCTGLTSISFPNSLTKIDAYAFEICSGLKEIWNYGLVPLEIRPDVFDDGTYDTATLYVPQSAKTEYEEDPVWQMFLNSKTFAPSNPTAIAAPADGDSMVTIRRIGGNAIFVDGANGKPVTVYDAAGHIVSRGKTTVIGLPHSLYIVRVGERSYKVAM